MRQFPRLSLGTRLTIVASLMLFPLALLVILSYVDERESRREARVDVSIAYTTNAASTIDGLAMDLEGFMAAAALVIGSQDEPISQESIGDYLSGLSSRYDFLTGFFVTDLDGIVVAHISPNDEVGLDLSSRPYMTALMGGEDSVWAGGLSGLRSGQLTTAYGTTIRGRDGQARGFLVAALRPSDIVGLLPGDYASDANLALIDQNGQIIFSLRDPQLETTERDLRAVPEVQRSLGGEVVRFESQSTPFDVGERFGAYVPITSMSWAVAYSRSQSVLNAEVQDALLRNIGLIGVMLLVMIGAFALISRQMTRPLAGLASAATSLSLGKDTVVPSGSFDPDVAKLEEAFSSMNAAVTRREDQLKDQARLVSLLDQAGAWIASDLDFKQTVQNVTQAATRLTEAKAGAFFHSSESDNGESYELNSFAGSDEAVFRNLTSPLSIELFKPTFRGSGPIRLHDLPNDPLYGAMAPGLSEEGELPQLRSYLAVPVSANSGVIGGLFFGHGEPGQFSERHERLAVGIASWAAIALDNARLYWEGQRIQERLRQSNQTKDEFLGLVSHELRTPTTTIYGGLRLLQSRRDRLSPEAVDELISNMAEESSRLARLIENLLAIARTEIGAEVDLQPTNVNDLSESLVNRFKARSQRRQVTFSAQEGLSEVLLELTYFEQTLLNLLTNSDRYSDVDKPIEVRTAQFDGEVRLTVSDRGSGVAPAELSLIFESFFRSEPAKSAKKGQGLGLAVCKRLTEAQSGRIWAENRPGGGLIVTLAFPAAPLASQLEA